MADPGLVEVVLTNDAWSRLVYLSPGEVNQTKSSKADRGLPSWRPCSVLPVLSDRRLWLAVLLPPLLLIVLLIVNSKSLLCGRRSGSYGY